MIERVNAVSHHLFNTPIRYVESIVSSANICNEIPFTNIQRDKHISSPVDNYMDIFFFEIGVERRYGIFMILGVSLIEGLTTVAF